MKGENKKYLSAAEFLINEMAEIVSKETADLGRLNRILHWERWDYLDFAQRYADYICSIEKKGN